MDLNEKVSLALELSRYTEINIQDHSETSEKF